MCKAFEEVRNEGYARGMQQGMQQAIQQNAINNIRTLMETMNWNPLQAMNALKIPEDEQQKYVQLLKQ